jgi:aconitate hydratase
MNEVLDAEDFISNYKSIFKGDDNWNILNATSSDIYVWDKDSSYIKEAPFFREISADPEKTRKISSARVLLKLGDSVTTDHISPAGSIAEDSPAGEYLKAQGIEKKDFNSYGSRRGNHEVMMRGTFANVRLKNELVDREGGYTMYFPENEVMTIFGAAEKYKNSDTPLIIIAGKEYGSGSSRDWAAKGVSLLGVGAIIAESFERIHRSNLVGMGVLPLVFTKGENAASLGLTGSETFAIPDLDDLIPNKELKVLVTKPDGTTTQFNAIARLDSIMEIAYFQNKGILQFVLRSFLKKNLTHR